jgi:Putative addiction module component
MSTISEVLIAAMSLNAEQRSEVVHQLLLTLEPAETDQDFDRAWVEEVQRRRQAIREGRSTLRDWDDALAAIRQTINSKASG